MDTFTIILIAIAAVLIVQAVRKGVWRQGLAASVDIVKRIAWLLPLAIVTAGFMGQVLPKETITGVIGAESGFLGILLASVIGGLLPGGPIILFPLGLALFEAGAGLPQTIAMLTGWSIYSVYRTAMFEYPVLGARFVLNRNLASFYLPPLAGVVTALIMDFIPIARP